MSKKDAYVVLDFETTGLNPIEERITQIAAIKVTNSFFKRKKVEKFETLVNPGKEISEFISNMTGITDEMVKDKPSESEAIVQLINFIGDSTIVAQNAPFDLGFLYHAALRAKLVPKAYNFFCTRAMTAIIFPNISHSLVDIVDLFDITLKKAHDALSDAEATFELFEKTSLIYSNMKINMKNKLVFHPDKVSIYTPENSILIKPKTKIDKK
ncbi:DNA polymerase III PolC-type [compost metagenome]